MGRRATPGGGVTRGRRMVIGRGRRVPSRRRGPSRRCRRRRGPKGGHGLGRALHSPGPRVVVFHVHEELVQVQGPVHVCVHGTEHQLNVVPAARVPLGEGRKAFEGALVLGTPGGAPCGLRCRGCGASNGPSAELEVPATDNSSRCSHTVRVPVLPPMCVCGGGGVLPFLPGLPG